MPWPVLAAVTLARKEPNPAGRHRRSPSLPMMVTGAERRSTASFSAPQHYEQLYCDRGSNATCAPDASNIVTNDRWFPDISLQDLREAMRLDGTVTQERLRLAAVDAIASVNDELRPWRAVQRTAGYAELASVPATQIDGISGHVQRYRRAVYNLARADLTEQYRSYDATKSGGQHAEELEATISESRRNVRWALNDLRGMARSTIELI